MAVILPKKRVDSLAHNSNVFKGRVHRINQKSCLNRRRCNTPIDLLKQSQLARVVVVPERKVFL